MMIVFREVFRYLVKEREYAGRTGEIHFWKSRSGSEVDYIEVSSGTIKAYECKWKDIVGDPRHGLNLIETLVSNA